MTNGSMRAEVTKGVARVIRLQLSVTLLLLLVAAIIGGRYVLTNDLKAKKDIVSARISAEMTNISSALDGLANSPVLWTALTDTTDRHAYLSPLLAGLNQTNTFRFAVLDYRGRAFVVPHDFFLTEREYTETASNWLESRQLYFHVLETDTLGHHVLMVAPIISPLSQSIVGYAISAYGIHRSLNALDFGAQTQINVAFDTPAKLDSYDFGWRTVSTTSRQTINTPEGEFVFYLTVTDSFSESLIPLLLALAAVVLAGLYARKVGANWSTAFAEKTLSRLESLVTKSRAVVRGAPVSLETDQRVDEISEIQNTLVKLLTDQQNTLGKLQTAASVYETAGEAILVADRQDIVVDVNAAFLSITSYSREEIIGQPAGGLYQAPGQSESDSMNAPSIAHNVHWRGETVIYDRSGNSVPVQLAMSVVHDNKGEETGRVAIFTDIREIKNAEERLRRLAYEDTLTGQPNYRAFAQLATERIEGCAADGQKFLFLFINLDRLKQINDLWGHDKGDDTILAAANHFAKHLPEGHVLGRRSGDEFLALVPVANQDSINSFRDQVQKSLCNFVVELDGNPYQATASIGITQYPLFGQTLKDLLQQADAALYKAKRSIGHGSVVWYDDQLGQVMKRHLVIQAVLPEAIKRGSIVAHFQPEVSLATGEIVGFETLARWHDPALGMVSPEEFITVAEESNLIVPLSHSILDQVFAALPLLYAKFPGVQVAINASPRLFLHAGFLERLRQFGAHHPDLIGHLVIEVTETDLTTQEYLLISQLHEMRELGIKVAIDDFGKGHSSLSRLANMPLDKLKIDSAFVAGIGDGVQEQIIEVILGFAQTLGLTVTAEGVETEHQMKWLQSIGCPRAQGWLYVGAVPLEDALALKSPLR